MGIPGYLLLHSRLFFPGNWKFIFSLLLSLLKASTNVVFTNNHSIPQSLYIFLYAHTSQMPEILHQVGPPLPPVACFSLSQVKVCSCIVPTHERWSLMMEVFVAHQQMIQHQSHFPPGPLLFARCLRFGFLEVKSDQGFRYMWFTEGVLLRKKPQKLWGSKGSRRGKGKKLSREVASSLGMTHGGLWDIKCPTRLSSELRQQDWSIVHLYRPVIDYGMPLENGVPFWMTDFWSSTGCFLEKRSSCEQLAAKAHSIWAKMFQNTLVYSGTSGWLLWI